MCLVSPVEGRVLPPVLAYYAKANPAALWQAAAATGVFIAALGAFGYATRRDLSHSFKSSI